MNGNLEAARILLNDLKRAYRDLPRNLKNDVVQVLQTLAGDHREGSLRVC